MNIMLACSLLELEIFKIFSVLSGTITKQTATRIQIAFCFTMGIGGHYMRLFLFYSNQDLAATKIWADIVILE